MPVRKLWGRERRETRGRKSSSAPSCRQRRHPRPPGQSAGTLALDCLLPGPPSVTVSSHGHRRLAPPQDRGPGHLPRPRPLSSPGSLSPEIALRAAAVRGADPAQALPSARPVPGHQRLRGAAAHTHTTRPPSPVPIARSPPTTPSPTRCPDVCLTGAATVPSVARAPPPRLQGNRGFRLLLWEPEVTVYSHGRPAARPRTAPAAHCQPRMGETRSRRKRGRRVKIRCIYGGGGR